MNPTMTFDYSSAASSQPYWQPQAGVGCATAQPPNQYPGVYRGQSWNETAGNFEGQSSNETSDNLNKGAPSVPNAEAERTESHDTVDETKNKMEDKNAKDHEEKKPSMFVSSGYSLNEVLCSGSCLSTVY